MSFERLDSMLASRLWVTGDTGSILADYTEALKAAPPDHRQIQGEYNNPQEATMPTSDTGMTLLSRESGNARYRTVFARARLFGQRATTDDEAQRNARSLQIDFDRLSEDLATMSLNRDPTLKGQNITPERRAEEVAAAKNVLTAILTSDEVRARALKNTPISRTGVLSLLNAGLGCLKMIHEGVATADSIFELVRGEVYDITQPGDVLKLSVKTAQKARETFVAEASVRTLVDEIKTKIDNDATLSEAEKSNRKAHVDAVGARVIEQRKALAQPLNVALTSGDGSKKTLENLIKEVRERMRAFRYDLDRMVRRPMTFMEGLRRGFDNIGRSQPTLTRASFDDALAAEGELNDLLAHYGVEDANQRVKTVTTVLSREHFEATTSITHLANNRIRYYFSGKEQKLESFRQRAHGVLDSLVKKGGTRTLQFEVGADAKFTADIGIANANCKVGGRYQYTTTVTVAPGGGEITVTTTHGGEAFGEASAQIGVNLSGKGSLGLSRTRTVKYRSLEDFIASLGGDSKVVECTPYGTMACLGKIGGFFRMCGRGLKNLATALGFRIAKSREDNAVYAARLRNLGIIHELDTMLAHRENAIRTQNGTSMNAKGMLGGSALFNVDTLDLEGGIAGSGSYDRTFARTATDYRTHLDTAHSHTEEWLQGRVGAWYEGLPVAAGEDRTRNALRAIEHDLQQAEDALASIPNKTRQNWKDFADKVGVLALKFAYVEKRAAQGNQDVSALGERLINPRVSVPEDVYDELMQDVANVTHNGTHKISTDFSVNWTLLGGLTDNVGKTTSQQVFGEQPSGFVQNLGARELNSVTSDVISSATSTIAPTSCTIRGTYTYTNPASKTSICSWSNAPSHTVSVVLTSGLTTRALVEFLARKYVDEDTTIAPEDRARVLKDSVEDFKGALLESLGISTLTNVWDSTMGELAKVAPKIASWLNAPVSMAGTGLDVGVNTDYQKRMTFTMVGGRLSQISVDDVTSVGSSLGIRVGGPHVSLGVHMKETLTTIDVDRAALVRPSLMGLMGQAEAYLRMGDREGFKGLLAFNAPGATRLWRAVTNHPQNQEVGNTTFVGDQRTVFRCIDEAAVLLAHIGTHGSEEDVSRARALRDQLDVTYRNLLEVPHDDDHRAQQVDSLADFVWTLTQCYTLARETGGFSRTEDGHIKIADTFPQRGETWASKVAIDG